MDMRTYQVRLNSIERVKQFSNLVKNVKGETWLSHKGYVINAKSILAIFSLDLTQILTLQMEEGMPFEMETFLA